MPVYLEYDKTDGSIKRVITANTLPANVAYLAYQEVPKDIQIDTSLNINEIMVKIMAIKEAEKVTSMETIANDEPEVIEV